jgi:GAF domain-containing protein
MKRRIKTKPTGKTSGRRTRRPRRAPAKSNLQKQIASLKRELRQAREQQTATAQVLNSIATSPGYLEPVFQTILENATQICEARFGILFRYEGDETFTTSALFNAPAALIEARRRDSLFRPAPNTAIGRMRLTKQPVHVFDMLAEPGYFDPPPGYSKPKIAMVANARTVVSVPILKNQELVGAIVIYRQEVRPFTDKQIELVQNFAAQAVIAIENTRLLTELRESLEQQTAASEVLSVISSSPDEVEPVFQAMLKNATRLCDAKFSAVFRYDEGKIKLAAMNDLPVPLAQWLENRDWFEPLPGSTIDDLCNTKRLVHVADVAAADGLSSPAAKLGGARTYLGVPMLRDGTLIGALSIYRQEIRPFTDKQIELVQNFAAQAVIAIENARLLNELRQRTGDLTESLEQQIATSEVLQVISSSPGELEPVFNAMLEHATRICDAKFGVMRLREGDGFRAVALHNAPASFVEERQRNPVVYPHPSTGLGQVIATKTLVHIADITADPSMMRARQASGLSALSDLAGARTVLIVPMLKDDQVAGVINIFRQEVRPFTGKQVALVQNFAAQAVIAIENTRLLNELRQRTDDLSEALEQQTATSEVLEVISSSQGTLEPVFQAMLKNATNICEANYGMLLRFQNGSVRAAAMLGVPPEFEEFWRSERRPGSRTAIGRATATMQTVHIADVTEEPAYIEGEPVFVAAVKLGKFRTILVVPMIKGDELVGLIAIYRQEVRPFTGKQIELVQNFAAQAVIAIENARLLNELRESLQQQTATAEVLSVISLSPGALEPVFNAMLANATRICQARFANLSLFDGERFENVTLYNAPVEYASHGRTQFRPHPKSGLGHVARTKQIAHIQDMRTEPPYREGDPAAVALADLAGARTVVIVPMLKDVRLVGTIAIYRQEVRPFSEKQIELLTNFAAQAVIAIENTRLLNELRQRTDDLSEALEQQTATSEVLRVISSSPAQLLPVFEAMLENATRICEAKFGNLMLFSENDSRFRVAATHGVPKAWAKLKQRDPVVEAGPLHPFTRVITTKKLQHIADMRSEEAYLAHDPSLVPFVEMAEPRTNLLVPMLKENELIGLIAIFRQEVRPFTDKQIALVQNFAAQAVIAIENTRLLNELRQRTDDLSEALEQQTATSEVLKVISSSPGELKPVFEAMLENAVRICEATFGVLNLYENGALHMGALHNVPTAFAAFLLDAQRGGYQPTPGSMIERVIRTKQHVHTSDNAAEFVGKAAVLGGARSSVCVPMVNDDRLAGTITIYRQEVRPFTDRQIELLQNFAAQAVIAIENTRLLNELRESLQQQTATADVLKVISRSTFDLHTVLDTLLRSAGRLCDADMGVITQKKGDDFYRAVAFGMPPDVIDLVKGEAVELNRNSGSGRALIEGKVIHIEDVEIDREYTWASTRNIGGYHTLLGVPMLRDGTPVGVLTLMRVDVRAFSQKEIELVSTFADQAAIAIENVRLFDEIQDKSRQLAEASQHKSQFLANMSHELRTPLNAILGYTELIIDGIYGETPEKAQAVLKRVESNGRHLLGLINDVLDLSKIEAGQLKLSLADYSIKDVVNNVANAVEPLATKKKLNFKVTALPDIPTAHGDEQKLTQVLLNLTGNAIKFTDAGEVIIKVTAENGSYTVAIRDTGPGISAADQEKLFQQFQQADNSITKSKGGTGLGLAISKKIIELHGGSISVHSTVGEGSTFAFTLPLMVEQQAMVPS